MNKYYSYILSFLIIVFGIFFLRSCDKKQTEFITKKELRPNENEAIIVDPNTGEIDELKRTSPNSKTSETVIERNKNAREARISIDDNGHVSIEYKTRGFERRFGFTSGLGESFRGGVDLEFYYWNRFGFIGGFSTDNKLHLAIYSGIDYRLPWTITRNTSLFVGFDTRKEIVSGIRIEL